jgi:hypothetical protein
MRTSSAKVRVRGVADRQAGRISAVQLTGLGIESLAIATYLTGGRVETGHARPSYG